jgi:hypothetical protein
MTFVCKHSDAEIAAILAEYEAGADRHELCARHGVSVRTLFRWQAKAGRSRPVLLQLVSTLHEENVRLRQLLGPENENYDAAKGEAAKRFAHEAR